MLFPNVPVPTCNTRRACDLNQMNVFSFMGLTSLFGRSGVFVFLRDENLKVRRALCSRIHRSVSKHKRRPRRDDCLCLIQERGWPFALLRRQKNVLTRFALACGCDFRPLQMSVRIRSLERAKDQVVQRQSHLRIWYSGSPNFHAVSIDVHRFIGAADDHGNGTGGRLIWIPVEFAGRGRLTLLATLRKEKTGMHSCRRRGMCVRDDNRRAFHCNAEEEFGKFQRKPDTSMRVRITRQVAGMEGYAAPGHPFHVRHLRALVDTRGMMHLLFQDREDAGGSTVTGSSSADA